VSERSSEDRSSGGMGSGLPWASVFDPVANARALEQIQRRGLQAAGELVDRLVSMVDGGADRDGSATNGDAAAPRATGSTQPDLVGVWADLVTRTLQAMARLSVPDAGTPDPTMGPVWVDVVTGRASGLLALVAEQGGGAAVPVEIWLHNPVHHGVGPLHLHVSELRSSEGVPLPGGVVELDPAVVEELPARSSRGIAASIRSQELLPPGRYRGLLQATGGPEVALPVELAVRPA
jgi:hypothetical protein